MSRDESKRRKDNCVTCGFFKPIKAKSMCQNCWHKVKRKTNKDFWLSTRYTEIVQRCTNPNNVRTNNYNGLEYCTREEFKSKFINDSQFLYTFEQWAIRNYDILYSPSIDRIDNTKGYTLDNIQVLTHSDNSSKDQERVAVNCYTKEGVFIRTFESQAQAEEMLDNVYQANVWKCCNGLRKTAGGYRFEYA